MGKKGKGPRTRGFQQNTAKEEKPNLFERMFNRKKFDILGKKAKGQQRKLGQARSDAVERRKKTLLVEYKQLKKSNVFVDRRFGENDETMTEEDKAIARFQKERMRELAGSSFALPEEEEGEEQLTHMGKSLADLNFRVGDRMRTEEEVAAEEQRRAELEEALQRKRARLDASDDDALPDQEAAAVPTGDSRARRRRLATEQDRQQKRARLHGPSDVLYGIVVQHFALRADALPFPSVELDALTPHLCAMTPEVPFFAAQVARARLLKMQERLSGALKAPGGDPAGAWPSARHVMLLRLWALLFPVSDRRHPVVTPAGLLVGGRAGGGLHTQGYFLGGLALQMAAAEGRFVPEPLAFATRLIRSGLASQHPAARDPDSLTASLGASEPRWFCGAALGAALGTLGAALEVFKGAASLPEIMSPARQVLDALREAAELPKELEEQRADVAARMAAACEACTAQRKKLVRKPGLAAPEIKQYNPRFEEEFVAGKDYDPDRSRAEERKLKRQVRKETRSAMRELRKDADFLGAQKAAERAAADAERRTEFRRGFALLEQQEADFKSGGQKGLWKKGKKLR
eukprot:jgi/Botrbrau1/19575/Bobra.0035s0060.1